MAGQGNRPLFAFHGIGVENGPDRTASLAFHGALFQTWIPPVKSCRKLIHKAAANLIDLNDILKVRHLQADAARDALDGTVPYIFISFSAALRVAVLVADHVGLFKNVRARLRLDCLAARSPERRANLHGGNFAVARLPRVWFADHLIFLGETRIENSTKIHVAGVPARAQHDAFSCLNV